ncbi:MAG: TIR domain-containing protein [Anaerolineales bacterium]|nr:TIR domain-containing protein [Anaerolineales bacterium]
MNGNQRLRVFLCHSKDDKLKIRKLYNRLIADNFDVWLDEVKLMPGQDWDLEIKKAVRNSDTVVVCISSSSITKEGYIQKEIRFALDVADEKPEGTIFLIPARLEVCNVPDRISRFQWVNLFEKSGYSKLKESLDLRMDDLNIRFNSKEVSPNDFEDKVRIPVLGVIDSRLPLPEIKPSFETDYYKDEESIEIARSLMLIQENGTKLFALEVRGNGLAEAMIYEGDMVVMKPYTLKNTRNGDMVAIWLPRMHETSLKFYFKEKDKHRLQPANPEMKPIYVSLDEPLDVKGKVVMIIRKVQS